MSFRGTVALLVGILGIFSSAAVASDSTSPLPKIDVSDNGYLFGTTSTFAVLQNNDSKERTLPEAVAGKWENVTGRIPKSTFPKKEVWIAFRLQNNSSSTRNWVLYPESGVNTERITYYIKRASGHIEVINNGAGVAFMRRPVPTRYLAAPIAMEPNETISVYTSIQSSFVSQNTLHIMSLASFESHEIQNMQILGIVFGIMLFAGITSLLYFFTLWLRAYFYYAVFCFTSGVHTLLVSGFILAALGETPNLFLGRYTVFTTAIMIISANLFAMDFLELWKHPIRRKMYQTMITLCALALGIGFIPGLSIGWTAIQALSAFSATLFILTAISLYKYKGATLFAFAWGIYAVGVLLWTGATQGFLPANFFHLYAPMILQAFQIILLTLAMFWHVKEIDRARSRSEIVASQSEKLKNLVRMLSHDLSNLIFSAKMHAESCKDDPSDTTLILESASSVEKICDNMSDIIESVRLMRAIEDGKVEMSVEPVCLREVLTNLKLSLEGKARSVNVGLHIENNLPENTKVLADKVALTHNVLANFVSNAIKFSPEGEHVKVTLWREEKAVKVTIADKGMGIPQDLLEKIFDPNTKSSRLGAHGERGTGFGMPVAKFMLERFGGGLHIDSKTKAQDENTGTTVTLTLKSCEQAQ